MIGDKRKFNIALVTLKAKGATGILPGGDELDAEAAALVDGVKTISDAKKSKQYTDIILQAIKDVNEDGSVVTKRAAKIQKFAILNHDVSVETDELTATYKLKRGFMHGKYEKVIEQIYESADSYVEVDSFSNPTKRGR